MTHSSQQIDCKFNLVSVISDGWESDLQLNQKHLLSKSTALIFTWARTNDNTYGTLHVIIIVPSTKPTICESFVSSCTFCTCYIISLYCMRGMTNLKKIEIKAKNSLLCDFPVNCLTTCSSEGDMWRRRVFEKMRQLFVLGCFPI